MLQVTGHINLEAQVIPGMHHFMTKCIFDVLAIADLVGAEQDTVVRVKTARLAMDLAVLGEAGRAAAADDVGGVEVPVEVGDAFAHEAHRGRVRKGPVAVTFALPAVALLVLAVPLLPVVEGALAGYLARQDLEVVYPPLGLRVEARARRVVLHDGWEVAVGVAVVRSGGRGGGGGGG